MKWGFIKVTACAQHCVGATTSAVALPEDKLHASECTKYGLMRRLHFCRLATCGQGCLCSAPSRLSCSLTGLSGCGLLTVSRFQNREKSEVFRGGVSCLVLGMNHCELNTLTENSFLPTQFPKSKVYPCRMSKGMSTLLSLG